MEIYGIFAIYHCVGSKFILRQGSRWLPDISKLSLPDLSCAKPASLVAPHADQAPLSATGKTFVAQRPDFHLSIWMLVELDQRIPKKTGISWSQFAQKFGDPTSEQQDVQTAPGHSSTDVSKNLRSGKPTWNPKDLEDLDVLSKVQSGGL